MQKYFPASAGKNKGPKPYMSSQSADTCLSFRDSPGCWSITKNIECSIEVLSEGV